MAQSWDSFWIFRGGGNLLGNLLLLVHRWLWVTNFVRVALRCSQRGRILESGCGTGYGSIMLRKIRGDNVVLLDISSNALEIASAQSKKEKAPVMIVQGDMHWLPFPDQSFDLAWNSGTIEHFPHPGGSIKEMKRVAKIVLCIIPAKGIIWQIYDSLFKTLGKGVRDKFQDETYCQFYTSEMLKSLFKKTGFNSIEVKLIRCMGLFPYYGVIGR